jgi:hypothetical protein
MWDVLIAVALMAFGAVMLIVVCAMIGWMIYTTQNGGDDE